MPPKLKTAVEIAAEAAAKPQVPPGAPLKTAVQTAMTAPGPVAAPRTPFVNPGGQLTMREFAAGGARPNMYGLYDPKGAANVQAAGQAMGDAYRRGYFPGQYNGRMSVTSPAMPAPPTFPTQVGARPSVIAPGDVPVGAGRAAGEAAEAGGIGARVSRAFAPVSRALAPVTEALAPVGRALSSVAPVARGLVNSAAYAAPLLNTYENYQNFSDINRVRDFNESLEEKSVLGRAVAGLSNPMTAISGASLATQEALGFDPTGQLAKDAEATRAANAAPEVAPALADARRRAAQTGYAGDAARADQVQDFQTRRAAQTGFSEDYKRAGMEPAFPSAAPAAKPAAPAAAKPATSEAPKGEFKGPSEEEMARFRKQTGTPYDPKSVTDKLNIERMRAGEQTFTSKQSREFRKSNPTYRPGQYVKRG